MPVIGEPMAYVESLTGVQDPIEPFLPKPTVCMTHYTCAPDEKYSFPFFNQVDVCILNQEALSYFYRNNFYSILFLWLVKDEKNNIKKKFYKSYAKETQIPFKIAVIKLLLLKSENLL